MTMRRSRQKKDKARTSRPRSRGKRGLLVERLEERMLLSGTVLGAGDDPLRQQGDYISYLPPQRTLINHGGFLSAPSTGDPISVAMDFLEQNAPALGLSIDDLDDYVVNSQYADVDSGITHVYLQQTHDGLKVTNANISVNLMPDGRVINVGSSFVPSLPPSSAQPVTFQPGLTAVQALQSLGSQYEWTFTSAPTAISVLDDVTQTTTLDSGGVSAEPVKAELAYAPTPTGVELSWSLDVQMLDAAHWKDGYAHWYDAVVNAEDGAVLAVTDFVNYASYNVFPVPYENPDDASGTRIIVGNPQDTVASPLGWHNTGATTYTDTRGNNVAAQVDRSAVGDEESEHTSQRWGHSRLQ